MSYTHMQMISKKDTCTLYKLGVSSIKYYYIIINDTSYWFIVQQSTMIHYSI